MQERSEFLHQVLIFSHARFTNQHLAPKSTKHVEKPSLSYIVIFHLLSVGGMYRSLENVYLS